MSDCVGAKAVQIDGAYGGFKGLHALSEQRNGHAREQVAAAAPCEACVAGGVDIYPCRFAAADYCVCALEHDGDAVFPREFVCRRNGICHYLGYALAAKTAHFAGVRGEYYGRLSFSQYIYIGAQRIYAVGVDDDGFLYFFNKIERKTGRVFVEADAAAEQHGGGSFGGLEYIRKGVE